MTSPVRIQEDHKRALARLRQEVARASGRQPCQQELLGSSIEFALRHRDEFIQETTWRPLSDAEIKRIFPQAQPLGRWSAEDIVYSDSP